MHDIVTRGGRCLIPVFALGRAQELLLILGQCLGFDWLYASDVCVILDEYWASHPELHDVPIYYASSLAQKCMAGMYTCLCGRTCVCICVCVLQFIRLSLGL